MDRAVVIDNGSGFIKAGMAGEDSPKVILPTLYGVPKMPGIMVGVDQKDFYVGSEVIEKAKFLNITEPIQNGQIVNMQEILEIWKHVFYQELYEAPSEHQLLFTDAPNTPRSMREEVTEQVFEELSAPAFYIAVQATLSLFASGRTTGLVVDSGDAVTHTVPIYEGFALPHGILQMPIAGRDLTRYFHDLLTQSGYHSASSNDKQIITQMKEQLCEVAFDYDNVIKNYQEAGEKGTEYELPGGHKMLVGKEKFMCAEALFQPSQIGKDVQGLADNIFNSVSKCDAAIRKELYENIVLAGGTCMVKNLRERINKDVKALAPSTMNIDATAPPERGYSAWLGGSILASIDDFRPMFITKAEYMEVGENIVYRKCF